MTSCSMCTKWDDEADLRIASLEHTYVILNRDQFFPGYCFVVAKSHVTELFHLAPDERTAVMDEVNAVAEALAIILNPDKINYELLGNMVPHMHWHVVPRFASDPLWPRPIWAAPHEPVTLSAGEYDQFIEKVRQQLADILQGDDEDAAEPASEPANDVSERCQHTRGKRRRRRHQHKGRTKRFFRKYSLAIIVGLIFLGTIMIIIQSFIDSPHRFGYSP